MKLEFCKDSYRAIIEAALKRGFVFTDYFTTSPGSEQKQIILRHDIDFSPAYAFKMAEIDAEYAIKSVFALLLDSPAYNAFSYPNQAFINGIIRLGHEVVLHHRVRQDKTAAGIKHDILSEFTAIKTHYPVAKKVFIWHNPPELKTISRLSVAGFINAYDELFTEKMVYISDSVMRNNAPDIIKKLDNYNQIHLLLHPIIWMSEQKDMVTVLSKLILEVVRDCEKEIKINREWQKKYPNGIPQKTLDGFFELLQKGGGDLR